MSTTQRLNELDKREERIHASRNPRYRAAARMCLAQIAREREELLNERDAEDDYEQTLEERAEYDSALDAYEV